MKKIVALFLCIVLSLGVLSACGEDSDAGSGGSGSGEYTGPELELTVNISSPEEYAKIYTAVFERISERTDGKVTFIYYYSGSLLSASESLNGLETGVCDFSDIALTNFKDQFPYTEQVVGYPFMEFDSFNMAAEVMNDVIMNNDLMLSEFETNNIQPLFFVGVWGTSMAMADDVSITGPDSLKGKKLVTTDPVFSEFLNDIGGTPVSQPPTEYYAALSNGIADGLVNGLNIVNIFGALDVTKSVYMFENSFTTGVKAVCASKLSWDSFDPSLQAIIMDEMQGEQLMNEGKQFWAESDQKHLDKAAELGIPITYIEGDQMQVWKDAMKPYGDAKLEDLYDKGYTEVYDVMDIWKEAIENYSSED